MFEVGKIYLRKELHKRYGGQGQGGISTPSKNPYIFLFTGESGAAYGYQDTFKKDGMFWYTGEGQSGDMEMLRGNRALLNHKENNKTLHLFEYTKKSNVRYLGESECVGYHVELRPDKNENFRKAFIFHLALNPTEEKISEPLSNYEENKAPTAKTPLPELRRIALQSLTVGTSAKQVSKTTFIRSEAIRFYALKRASGICEGCNSAAPFQGKHGPFLEVHHLTRLSDGGPDHPKNVIAICPNCHRRAHFSKDREEYNQILSNKAKIIEP